MIIKSYDWQISAAFLTCYLQQQCCSFIIYGLSTCFSVNVSKMGNVQIDFVWKKSKGRSQTAPFM